MSAWQPIETAPKDGSEILLFARGNREFIGVGQWAKGATIPGTLDVCDMWFWSFTIRPTHWMPLPSVPPLYESGPVEDALAVLACGYGHHHERARSFIEQHAKSVMSQWDREEE